MEKRIQMMCRDVLLILALLCGIKILFEPKALLRKSDLCSDGGTVILLAEDRVFGGTGYYARYYVWIASEEEKICFAVRQNEYKMHWIGERIELSEMTGLSCMRRTQ